MKDLKKGESLQKHIKEKIKKLRALKTKYGQKMTIVKLKAMKGFENISDERAKEILIQLEEYVSIVLRQKNRLQLIKTRGYE